MHKLLSLKMLILSNFGIVILNLLIFVLLLNVLSMDIMTVSFWYYCHVNVVITCLFPIVSTFD
jgi:hypothetical protein